MNTTFIFKEANGLTEKYIYIYTHTHTRTINIYIVAFSIYTVALQIYI